MRRPLWPITHPVLDRVAGALLAIGALAVVSAQVVEVARVAPPIAPHEPSQEVAASTGVTEADSVSEPETVELLPEVPRTCQVALPDALPADTEVFAHVTLASTGQTLWSVRGQDPTIPASVLKLVTARAALEVLGPDYRLPTRVYVTEGPTELWLVGGGDPTLTRLSSPDTPYYAEAARLDDLVEGTVAEVGEGTVIARVRMDVSRYDSFPEWLDTWRPTGAALGFVSPVTSLMVDGGRLIPSDQFSARTTDPVGQVGDAFVEALREAGLAGDMDQYSGDLPPSARLVAEVWSPPVRILVRQMIGDSDNQIAEVLAREIAVVAGDESLDAALRRGLPEHLRDSMAFSSVDGSGLSSENRLTAELAVAVVPDRLGTSQDGVLWSALARPGESGSLSKRFSGPASAVSDHVYAKTGTLPGVRSLAGMVTLTDDLRFAVFLVGPGVDDPERATIDSLVAELSACGENLADWTP